MLGWVAISFSRESSQPRDWTWVAARIFTMWAAREALIYFSLSLFCFWSHYTFILLRMFKESALDINYHKGLLTWATKYFWGTSSSLHPHHYHTCPDHHHPLAGNCEICLTSPSNLPPIHSPPCRWSDLHNNTNFTPSPPLLTTFSSTAQPCPTLQPHESQHARPPCPSPTPRVQPNPCQSSRWCIQPSHPLSSPSPPALNPSQRQGLFKWVSSSHQVTKVLEFQLQHQSFQWIPRTDLL